jgi:hypothetical protein
VGAKKPSSSRLPTLPHKFVGYPNLPSHYPFLLGQIRLPKSHALACNSRVPDLCRRPAPNSPATTAAWPLLSGGAPCPAAWPYLHAAVACPAARPCIPQQRGPTSTGVRPLTGASAAAFLGAPLRRRRGVAPQHRMRRHDSLSWHGGCPRCPSSHLQLHPWREEDMGEDDTWD